MSTAVILILVVIGGCGTAASTDHDSTSGRETGETPSAVDHSTARPPAWYAQRDDLASCGIDAEYTAEYPNVDARLCFRTAYERGESAELTTVTFGDEGESLSAHFRILGPDSYEIVGEHRSAPDADGTETVQGWERMRCDHLVFLDAPGSEVDGVPLVNAEGECEPVDYVGG